MVDKTIKIDKEIYDKILAIKEVKFWTIKRIAGLGIQLLLVEIGKGKK